MEVSKPAGVAPSYTFVEQVRRHGMDPFAYFEWVFDKLMHNPGPEELEALLPASWIKAQESSSQTIEVYAWSIAACEDSGGLHHRRHILPIYDSYE